MITLMTDKGEEHTLIPTIFPDGTSQVWKLPEHVLKSSHVQVVWNFEAEREIMDLLSLRALMPICTMELNIPYLPYARQDKYIGNSATFNLRVFAEILNSMRLSKVTAVDVHNPIVTAELIDRFENIEVGHIHARLFQKLLPEYLVFPDRGAYDRYEYSGKFTWNLVCDKVRDPLTGQILSHACPLNPSSVAGTQFLILDDLCDGGATFLSVARSIRAEVPGAKIALFVTHGIFSKGREALLIPGGVDEIYTTNSLLKNKDGYDVKVRRFPDIA